MSFGFLSNASRRGLLQRSSLVQRTRLAPSSSSSVPQRRLLGSLSPEQKTKFQEEGILDEQGLVNFDTLHNMQVRGCQVFAPRKLFGTYSASSKQFEWMTFGEFGALVDRCRAMLKDVGESSVVCSSFRRGLSRLMTFSHTFSSYLSFYNSQEFRTATRWVSFPIIAGNGPRLRQPHTVSTPT
jgi:hypothetical protein